MTKNSPADWWVAAMTPLALDGNSEAARSLVRLAMSNDPDTEAKHMAEECVAIVGVMLDILEPVINLWEESDG